MNKEQILKTITNLFYNNIYSNEQKLKKYCTLCKECNVNMSKRHQGAKFYFPKTLTLKEIDLILDIITVCI